MENFISALEFAEKQKDKITIAQILNDVGLIYWSKEECDEALKFFKQSLKIREELKDERGLCQGYNNVGLIYTKNKEI